MPFVVTHVAKLFTPKSIAKVVSPLDSFISSSSKYVYAISNFLPWNKGIIDTSLIFLLVRYLGILRRIKYSSGNSNILGFMYFFKIFISGAISLKNCLNGTESGILNILLPFSIFLPKYENVMG